MEKTGTLRIAGPYDDWLIESITTGFEALLNSRVTLAVVRDDSLIGGFVVQIDGSIYDASLRSKLSGLKAELTRQ